MDTSSLLWLIPVLPLLGFMVNGLVGPRLSAPAVGVIAVTGPALAFALAVLAFLGVHEAEGPASVYFTWIHTGGLDLGFGLTVDALSAIMLLNVTGVGTAIHVYSYGYMHEDESFSRFMAYLNLFLCAMIILVMGDSLMLLFVGWEGVGLCSYLLIGFWYEDLANVDAGRKAFVVNRVGDFAFLMGAFTLFALTGTLAFSGMEASLAKLDPELVLAAGPFAGWTVHQVLLLAGLCLFGGATGKSAQIPLYVWLPDAMAGPTPVSALIHAATMVTAGVYLMGRMDFLFVALPEAGTVVAVIAALTAFLSGAIAFAQYDIKKVLAYSTVSQLGFMFAGMATTVWTSGLFHVLTHAFFKALLFLGAGAVIHALHGEQDIRKMGGLRKDLFLVFVLFLVGSLALAGVPPFAGFWSKDEILGSVHLVMTHQGGAWVLVWWLLVVTAAMTAFYTTRLVILTFFGEPHDHHRHLHHPHWTMTSVLVFLAILSVAGGMALGPTGWLHEFTHPVWSQADWMHELGHEAEHTSHEAAMMWSVGAVLLGIGSAVGLYGFSRGTVDAFVAGPGKALQQAAYDKFYVDELYAALIVRPVSTGARLLWAAVDRRLIDGLLVEGSGKLVMGAGALLRRTQVGAVTAATSATLAGAVAVLLWLVTHG
ncbi:MAG TPA: NADH-quinone oxidoreductase subunit L [Myxococcota bacterium]|nr:NADH-quinone oxidoreductase subunit L [Myxococcota bacterium]